MILKHNTKTQFVMNILSTIQIRFVNNFFDVKTDYSQPMCEIYKACNHQ